MTEKRRITAIEPQKRRKNRFSVYVDGRFWAALDGEALALSGLRVGLELTLEELERIRQTSVRQSARNKALAILARSRRSEGQIRERLAAYGYPDDVIADTLEFLRRYRLVDDADLARERARAAVASSRPRGPNAVRERLRREKIASTVVEEAIAEVFSGVDLVDSAVRFIQGRAARIQFRPEERKLARLAERYVRRGYPAEAARRAAERELRRRNAESLTASLIRHGYPPDVAREAVRRVLSEQDEELFCE